MTPLTEAKRVLSLESSALAALSDSLGSDFETAIDFMLNTKGRVILSGMGKSGLVARKIAATLASTGTPSFFVHPAEASHGDLGMISPDDSLIMLSTSGETSELSDLLHFARRWNMPLIAITQKSDSTLAQFAGALLILPPIPEACPLGLAPTTSTTMMMALGDALALALLSKRGFSHHDFGQLHPGGKLGQRLQKVSDLMHVGDHIPLIQMGTLMGDALLEISTKRLGCVGVIGADDALQGIITDGDLRRHMRRDLLDLSVEQIMTKPPQTIAPDVLAQEALRRMNTHDITHFFVVDPMTIPQKPLGIVHIHDFLRRGIL